MLRIAYFTDTYLPNMDGVVKSLILTKKYLEKRGHKVYVFSPSPTGKEYREGDVFYFKSMEFPPYPQYRISFPNFPEVNKIVSSLNIDVIHNHGIALTSWAAVSASKKYSIPSVSTFHTDITKTTHYIIKKKIFQKFSQRIAWSYLRFLYSRFDVITAPSKRSVSLLRKRGIISTYIPNGIEFKPYSSKRKRENYILHVGRLVKEKEVDFIFPCLKDSSLKLIIAGDGPAKKYYMEKAKKICPGKVKFTGFVSDRKLKSLYREAIALIFCSTFDTQGLVVLESLSNGTPVVFRKATSAEEIAKKLNTGFTSCKSFWKKVEKAKKIKEKECVEIAKEYDIKRVVRKWENLYYFLSK